MKRRYSILSFSVALSMVLLSGCGSTSDTGNGSGSAAESTTSVEGTVYGEITEVSEDGITIEIGTTESDIENTSSDEGSAVESVSSTAVETVTLDLTGETQEIGVTEDTVITRESSSEPEGGDVPDAPPDSNGGGNGASGGDPSNGNGGGDAPDTPPDNTETETDSTDTGSGSSSDEADSTDTSSESDTSEDDSTEMEEFELDDLSVGDTISVTVDADGMATEIIVISSSSSSSMSMGGGQSSGVDSYDAVVEYTSDTEVSGEAFTSTGTDENAIHVFENAIVSLDNITVDRTSSDSTGGDTSSFYGVGAAILNTQGTTYISDAAITTDAAGGAGIFSYGDGVTYVSDSTIETQQDTSGGIHVAGGGTLYAWDLDVETNGESAAAIRSDRGSGTMVVDGGTYTSNGTGSPAIYSTADITVNDATLTANGSEAICIEGLNTIRLFDSDLTGNMSENEQNDCVWNVILYQSMSGDSEVGNSTFEMIGGSLTAQNGGMFYTTNTESTFILSDVDITYSDDNDFFLQCTGNNNQRGWGTSGSNGADCLFLAEDQEMEGDIIWDSISTLNFYMTEGSTLTGAVINDETYAGNGGDGYCNLYIAKGCTWIVTGDSTLSSLQCAGTIVDADGNTVTIQGSDGTVYVEGTSDYTITTDSYEESVDLSDAPETSNWSDYEVEKPSELS